MVNHWVSDHVTDPASKRDNVTDPPTECNNVTALGRERDNVTDLSGECVHLIYPVGKRDSVTDPTGMSHKDDSHSKATLESGYSRYRLQSRRITATLSHCNVGIYRR